MNSLTRITNKLQRQVNIILAISEFDRQRKASGSPIGSWESLVQPLQLMLFFILMRVGFSFLKGSNRFAAGGTTDMYFNIVIFMSTGFCIVFLFRNVALKALMGLKLRTPLYFSRVTPLDILLGLSLNDVRALATLSLGIFAITWYFTWDFRLDSPGLAVVTYLLTVLMAIGFGLCVVFLGKLNKMVVKIIRRVMQRVIIFTSGFFFATNIFPGCISAWKKLSLKT